MTQRLTATQFHAFTSSGRTSPARSGCEDGTGAYAGDFVVKLTGAMDSGVNGHLCELLGSRVATHFGVAVPSPAVVTIDAAFANLVADSQQQVNRVAADRFRQSVGVNFGSRHLVGVSAWPTNRKIPEHHWQAATDIFAFDALIENPDRRSRNPNLFTSANHLTVFDHECAFSFLLDIFPPQEPWKLTHASYLNEHVFFSRLKKQSIDLSDFRSALRELRDDILQDIVADVPEQWKSERLDKAVGHLQRMRAHAEALAQRLA